MAEQTEYILIRWVAKANGSWQHVHGQRGYYRAVHVDTAKGNPSGLLRSRGTVCIIAESRDVDSGTRNRPTSARQYIMSAAERYAASNNLPIKSAIV